MSGSLLDRKIEGELAQGKQGWFKAFRRSRAFRTFVRDRAAVVALGVISVYISIAVLIIGAQLVNAISGDRLADTFIVKELSMARATERVGPDSLPGFFEQADADTRLQHADYMLSQVERELDREDPEAALRDVNFAELRVVDAPIEEIDTLVMAAYDQLDEVDIIYEDYENLLDDLADAREEVRTAVSEADAQAAQQRIDTLKQDTDEAYTELLTALDVLDERVDAVLPDPAGFGGFMYNMRLLLGTDSQGRSIMWRAVYSIRVATQVGLVSAIIAVVVGAFLGAMAGFFGGWVDHAIVWLYSTLSSVPYIVLLTVVAFVFGSMEVTVPFTDGVKVHQTLIPMYVAFGVTFWIAPCRQIRGEALKIRSLDYVQSATALGAGRFYIMRKHIIPNVLFLVFINFSLIFIGAIKSEVILSFLGIGVQGQPSWGVMISESRGEVLKQFFWQIGSATAFMFGLVLAFNVFSDALQDAFDPKHAR
ncbi:MAG: ABC transporter permease subunit [Phycisphaera sp.]|nr:MAG: ABC transporter permease subunit [Phycisphaera sp.]